MLVNKLIIIKFGFIFSCVLIFLMFFSSGPSSSSIASSISVLESWTDFSNQDYESNCLALYKKLRFPNASLFFYPALKEPPKEMYDEFIQYGKMPIKKWWYFNEIYSDSKGDQSKNKNVIKKEEMDYLIQQVKNNKPQANYGDMVNI